MLLALLFAPALGTAAPNVLAVASAVDTQCHSGATPAVVATAGSGAVNTTIFLDYDTNFGNLGVGLVADMSNSSATTIFSISNNATVNHAPYSVGQLCFTNTGLAVIEGNYYGSLVAANGLVAAVGPGKNTAAAGIQLPSSMMLVTSPNSVDGNMGSGGPGTEFFLSASYLGLTTNSDSADVGALSGIAAAVALAHSGFNAFDLHAALRQTSSNWSTGWNSTTAFGTVSYATASGTISTVFLQAPNLQIMNHGYYIVGTLYPFKTTRRVNEVVYLGGTWPSPATGCSGSTCNEYTAAQIASAGGTLIYTSNGTDATPTFTYAPAASGSATFHALTLDASGNGSRVESFNAQSETFTVGTACAQ